MLKDLRENRLKKIRTLEKRGIPAYPPLEGGRILISEILAGFENLARKKTIVRLAGRIMAHRIHGGAAFLDCVDGSGKIQLFFKKDVLGKEYQLLEDYIDIGDFLWAEGSAYLTQRGEKSIEVKHFSLIAKCVTPLPEKWHGLQDIEERYRKRYLDLIFNDKARETFRIRSATVRALRSAFETHGFLEVETPFLQILPGGALARPFETKLNALHLDLHLRIAPELYLKRLLVGQFEKIYEIGKAFRNEGMDRSHNPEFTILEAYQAHENAEGFMQFVETTLSDVIQRIAGAETVVYGDKHISLQRPWQRIEYDTLLKKYTGVDLTRVNMKVLQKKVKDASIQVGKKATKWELVDELYKKVCQPNLTSPAFVTGHPIEISPLAKRRTDDKKKADRFQLVIGGLELVNGFSELNDPREQYERFREQERLRKSGAKETQRMDRDFIEALEYGMPPAAGLGIGVDRLVMLLTDSHNIREVILFPTMRPKR